MDTLKYGKVEGLADILEHVGAEVRYGLDGELDEVIMSYNELIKYTNVIIWLTQNKEK
jgi:hypothetical protein